jgi:hypothetical protein
MMHSCAVYSTVQLLQEGNISAEDFRVGAALVFYARGFELLDADEATLHYMEENAPRFPWADYNRVGGFTCCPHSIRHVPAAGLSDVSACILAKHTVTYDVIVMCHPQIMERIQGSLRRSHGQLDHLRASLIRQDVEGQGYITKEQLHVRNTATVLTGIDLITVAGRVARFILEV